MITNDPSSLSPPPGPEPEIAPIIPDNQIAVTPAASRGWIEVLLAGLTWGGSVLLLLLVPPILGLPYVVYLAINKSMPRPEALLQDKTFILIQIIAVVPAHLLTLVLAWMIVSRRGRLPFWKKIGFSWPASITPLTGYAFCFLISLVLLGIGVLVTYLVDGGKTDLDKLIESSYQARLATAFLATATAPLVEEIIYRGILYPAIQRVLGMGLSIAIVSLLFAGVHVVQYWNNIGVILVITILSFTLTTIRALSNKLLPSFVIHLIFNGLQSLYLVLEPFVDKTQPTPEPAPGLIHAWLAVRHLF